MSRRPGATALVVTLGLAVALLLGLSCGRGGRRILVFGVDGLDPQALDLLIGEGKLPHFATLRRDGAHGRLRATPPLLSPVLWTTIATGQPPTAHGIGHFVAVSESGQELPVTSRMRRVPAVWNLFSDAGREIAVVGWWATWPAETVRGAIVSDHTCYHFLFPEGLTGASDPAGLTHPPELFAEIAPLVIRPAAIGAEELRPFLDIEPSELERPFSFADDVAHFRWALATARSYAAIAARLWRERQPDLLLLYLEGTDSASHLFGHLFRAAGLSGELAEQQRRYGHAVEAMYVEADRILGELMASIDRDTALVVLSDHGFALGELPDDPSSTRDLRRVSERYHRADGVLYLYGAGVRAGAQIAAATQLDVAPTLLALAGLPATTAMPGRVLTEALREPPPDRADPPPAAARPAGGSAGDPTTDPQLLARLRSLGYVGARSPDGERNLAALHFAAGRYAEALAAYERLVAAAPDDAGLRTSLAGALGALGRYDEAERHLRRALELDPLDPEAHHNLAVLAERRGERDEAVRLYREAVRYVPGYQPARAALARLGEPVTAAAAASGDEPTRRALALAEAASEQARAGDYPGALAKLAEAERLAPDLARVHHYRANVAYLAGDRAAAIAALERALALEPDNALFRQNLETLRREASAAPPADRR